MQMPELAEVASIIADLGLTMSDADVAAHHALLGGIIPGYGAMEGLPMGLPEVTYDRSFSSPDPSQNELGAWYVMTEMERAPGGKLDGKTVAIKDNVFIADVPLMNGTRIIEGFEPSVDATIVTRILDAGGEIVGKSVCEAYCTSGASHTSETGPVHNPHRHGYSTGGSSSGSGALVGSGAVDLAIGCDQGGSIRIPASWSGCYGMKPTHGLVPYTGILGMHPSIDYTGPMTSSVEDNALFLEVLAGPDELDPRQSGVVVNDYSSALGKGVSGLKIGLLQEGFGTELSEPDVDDAVRAAVDRLRGLGAEVTTVSVPLHAMGGAILFGVIQSIIAAGLETDGYGFGREDALDPSFLAAHAGWRERPDDLPETMKNAMILAEMLHRQFGWEFHARAVNLFRVLRAAYDVVLSDVDLIALPTTAMKAQPHPPADAPVEVSVGASWLNLANTSPFNVSHHPAMSVPCAMRDGLPVGMMLVGRPLEETTIYSAAHAFEEDIDWRES
ncbi:MAG: amidase [Gemmatimonadota bacterium]|nr:amidase [Gemmatimonadota bacterium]